MRATGQTKSGAAIALALLLVAATGGRFAAPAAAQVAAPAVQLPMPMPPAGLARVWFVRQYEPGENLSTPMIYANGAPVASSVPGTIFYRDLAPGTYTLSVESCGTDVSQDLTVQLAPGGHAELEIQSLQSFTPPDCPPGSGTLYVRPINPRFLQLALPQLAYLGGR
jgi:hypothetical protein